MAMALKVGDSLPDVTLKTMGETGPKDIAIKSLCASGATVIFALPGAYTPQCSARHLPGFLEHAADFKAKGVDRIACLSVNDVFVMDAWAKHNHVDDKVLMLADGNAEFTRAAGLDLDARGYGMGVRSQRYAMVIKNGAVTHMFIEEPGAFEVSAAAHVLSKF
jgi:glutaredoxin/glutathione-dependent peroxiredoxin